MPSGHPKGSKDGLRPEGAPKRDWSKKIPASLTEQKLPNPGLYYLIGHRWPASDELMTLILFNRG